MFGACAVCLNVVCTCVIDSLCMLVCVCLGWVVDCACAMFCDCVICDCVLHGCVCVVCLVVWCVCSSSFDDLHAWVMTVLYFV